ncbi:hypothetical protein ACF0H5_016978 [Mactra antiquata]
MGLPVAAIVSIVLACWVILVLVLFGVYKFLKYRGSCDCECAPCGREGGENTCCKSVSESCNCCNPSLQGCLNSACPKKKISCVDIILCQCCAEPGQDSCLVNLCKDCGTLQNQPVTGR